MLLLSGGIDSPVAGWMMAKRGLELDAVHFFSYPYTSLEAKDKVLALAELLSRWCGRLTVHIVPFTDIQLAIHRDAQEDYGTILMRRSMMRIAARVAEKSGCGALITGESLGQVASQTIESLTATGSVCPLPVFRPAIGLDKEEIIQYARRIGTLETSILPYEDCCTVFTAKHPQTRPRLYKVEGQEARITGLAALEDAAVAAIQRVRIQHGTIDS
jgi:thiamine biosynthesis protein ThiI